jgi:hypothetical protein
MKNLLLAISIFSAFSGYGQINVSDSTVQVIGYWDKNEKQTYWVSQEKFKVKAEDTTAREYCKYTVDVTITDSTADSYTIDWFYHDFDIHSEEPLTQKLNSLIEDITITIKTDELGTFEEVVNWKEIRDYMYKATGMLKEEMKAIPNMDKVIGQIENMYSTKESIEAGAINEIQQFYTFHGAMYKRGEEYSGTLQVANMFGGKPFDTYSTVWLDEINSEDNNSIMRSTQQVNSEQLTEATFKYLVQIAETMKVPPPKRSDIPPLKNETRVASRIHNSGWIIYSILTKETSAEGQTNVDETVIEIQ